VAKVVEPDPAWIILYPASNSTSSGGYVEIDALLRGSTAAAVAFASVASGAVNDTMWITTAKSACRHRSGMSMVFSLTLRRVRFGVLIQSAAPSSREQTVPSAPERELLLQ